MRLAVSLGGSVFTQALDRGEAGAYADAFADMAEMTELLVVVVGAGSKKQRIREADTENQVEKDLIGIEATRENADTLIGLCEELELSCCPSVPTSIAELRDITAGERYDVVVMGGTEPGHSTDAVAALAAELIDAEKLLKATDVDGLYTGDPDMHPDAEKYEALSHAELVNLLCGQDVSAGSYALFDLVAAKLVQRSGIPATVFDGSNPANVVRAARGEAVGTRIG